MTKNPTISDLDQQQIIQRVFNGDDDRLRVDAGVTIDNGQMEVAISDTEDSIRIGNGNGNKLAVNSDGSINVNSSGSSTVSGTVSANINGLATFQTSQYTVGTSAVLLTPTPLINRSSLSIKVITTSTNIIYIGNSSGVTSSTGYPLFNGDSIQLDLKQTQSIYAIASASGQTVCVAELGS